MKDKMLCAFNCALTGAAYLFYGANSSDNWPVFLVCANMWMVAALMIANRGKNE